MKIALSAVAAPLIVIAIITVAWAIDGWRTGDHVARNVHLAGTPVGGQTAAEVSASVDELAEVLPDTEVRLAQGDEVTTSTAGEMGIAVDREATRQRVLDVGRTDPLPTRPIRWFRSLFSPRAADVVVAVDAERLSATLRDLEGDRRTLPVEPTITYDEVITPVPGTAGRQITVHDVIAAIPPSLGDVDDAIVIEVEQTETPPRVPDDVVTFLAAVANEVTAGPLSLVAGGRTYEVEGERFRPAFDIAVDSVGDGAQPRLTMAADEVRRILDEVVSPPSNPTGVRFDIQGGRPVPVGGEDTEVCCGDGAGQAIVDALLEGETTVELPTRRITAAEGRTWADALGVREVIGEFTTRHGCCESRVTNIHRISDLTRGILIPPGATFSVNDTVGRRTRDKGFVEGGVIVDGEFTTDIGGGVSQYATTLFNAAFFGGLDIPVYKAHSKYISRYPYGREATLYYPGVDLKIHNNTPHGVVIWPTYTGTSITVQLWSTRYVAGEQTGQSRSSGCGSVTTERTRVWVDGRVETDTFRARYDCD